ncbi:carboxypeptidase-like regulatory domain-containing protein [Limibacter armeniacum]|uniref:carboxypeptidase-like regulatory domain-containing protein n=1 Tax=Limibacter armeniacum TaxID=466084 RepID=UPI002FE5B862
MIKATTKLLFFLALSLSYSKAIGQNIFSGLVLDAKSHAPIPFAEIGVLGSTNGTTSNPKGWFSLKMNPTDTVIISHIGYKEYILPNPITEKSNEIEIHLQEITLNLNEVTVNSKQSMYSDKIENNEKKSILTGGSNQYAMYLPNKRKASGFIEVVYFDVNPEPKKYGRWESLVRIRVYYNQNDKSGEDLLVHPINIRLSRGTIENGSFVVIS